MEYSEFDTIIKKFDNDTEISLVMYQKLKIFVDNKLKNWGTITGKQFRFI